MLIMHPLFNFKWTTAYLISFAISSTLFHNFFIVFLLHLETLNIIVYLPYFILCLYYIILKEYSHFTLNGYEFFKELWLFRWFITFSNVLTFMLRNNMYMLIQHFVNYKCRDFLLKNSCLIYRRWQSQSLMKLKHSLVWMLN